MASYWPSTVDSIYIAIYFVTFLNPTFAAGQQQAPVAIEPPKKTLIPNLPLDHYQFWLKNSPSALKGFEKICSKNTTQDINDIEQFRNEHSNFIFEDERINTDLSFGKKVISTICSKIGLVRKSCWGYETNCDIIYLMPECSSSSSDSRSEQDKKIEWFRQADFGFILDRRRELSRYCAPDKHSNYSVKSSLECTKYFRTCRGENLYIGFGETSSEQSYQSGPIILRKGHIGGWNCDLQSKRIEEEGAQRGFLKSWFNELEHYNLISSYEPEKACDERIEKQVYLIQLDSNANMYHYFCSFLNLYATMHLNNRFSEDNQLILWDKKLPNSQFEIMWSVFSRHEPKSLHDFEKKKVCLDKFIFTMPPKMINGLHYHAPLVEGCSKSGLFDAFNKHVLYKLRIDKNEKRDDPIIRVTIISQSKSTRRILNENDIKTASDNISDEFQTRVVDFASMTFLEQLKITHSTDILVGVHGDGLTHTLFLPDWGSLLELHDCKDKRYRDLARFRGVSYFTLDNRMIPAKKSMNFTVDVNKFTKTLVSAAQEVKRRKGQQIQDHKKDLQPNNNDAEPSEKGSAKGETNQSQPPHHTEL